MSVERFPGMFRVGALNETVCGVQDSSYQQIDPKFLVLVVLRGRQVFYLDDERIELEASSEDDATPVAFVVLLMKQCTLRYAGSWGDPFRKISIAGPPDWFDQFQLEYGSQDALPNFPQTHLDYRIWHPSQDVIRLSQQIVSAPAEDNAKKTGLFRMSRALEILRRLPDECESQATPSNPATTDNSNEKLQERIRLHILQNLSSDLSLNQLEKDLHLNRRSIQRSFKQGYGITLSDFIRKERLNKANRALQQDGISIATAAHIAGYSSSANFATAFRKAFGMAPKQVRNRSI